MTERLRVFLVDDHDVARAGARHYLGDRFDIVGEADNALDAADMICDREPDIVLLDVHLPGGGGASVVTRVRRTHPDIRFLAFTVSAVRKDVLRLLDVGVDGYVTKGTFGPDLPDLIAAAADGRRPVSPDVAGYLLDIDEQITEAAGIEKLTPKEREVVNLIARGYTYRETSARLDISVKTLETHMHHIFAKLGVASRHELSRLAFDTGFVRPDDTTGHRGEPL
ncbi:MAG: response regulator transcription factor [Actinomycetia bacterium]|nr:response regulator transcription factor [Actinomycetes bacterium]